MGSGRAFGGRSVDGDRAAAQQHEAIAMARGQVDVVADDDDGQAVVSVEPPEEA
jgi:hypothetical protein